MGNQYGNQSEDRGDSGGGQEGGEGDSSPGGISEGIHRHPYEIKSALQR